MVSIPWTSPRTWASAILTAPQLNVDIRDNLNYLYTPPRVSATRAAAKSVVSGAAAAAYDFDQEDYDTDAMHVTSGSNTRFTVKTAGVYLFTADVAWGIQAGGRRYASFVLNGSATAFAAVNAAPTVAGECGFVLVRQRLFAVNDYIELTVFQDSGSAVNATAALAAHWLSN